MVRARTQSAPVERRHAERERERERERRVPRAKVAGAHSLSLCEEVNSPFRPPGRMCCNDDWPIVSTPPCVRRWCLHRGKISRANNRDEQEIREIGFFVYLSFGPRGFGKARLDEWFVSLSLMMIPSQGRGMILVYKLPSIFYTFSRTTLRSTFLFFPSHFSICLFYPINE